MTSTISTISLWNPVSIKALVHVGFRNINFIEYTCIKYKKVIFKLLLYILTIENIHCDSKIYDPNSVIKADHLVNTCKSAAKTTQCYRTGIDSGKFQVKYSTSYLHIHLISIQRKLSLTLTGTNCNTIFFLKKRFMLT